MQFNCGICNFIGQSAGEQKFSGMKKSGRIKGEFGPMARQTMAR